MAYSDRSPWHLPEEIQENHKNFNQDSQSEAELEVTKYEAVLTTTFGQLETNRRKSYILDLHQQQVNYKLQ